MQVIVEKAERSDIPDIDKKKLVALALTKIHISFNSNITTMTLVLCSHAFKVKKIDCIEHGNNYT